MLEADGGGCGGLRRGGGGGEEEEDAVDDACWAFTVEDRSTPVGGLMIGFLHTVVRISLTLWL